jgi:hypothetical protein
MGFLFMWEVMRYLGPGTLHREEDGTLVYSAPCTCGNDLCGDEVILNWTYAASTCTGNRGLKSRLSLPAMSLRRHW